MKPKPQTNEQKLYNALAALVLSMRELRTALDSLDLAIKKSETLLINSEIKLNE